ncbi:hypothetical protein L6452_43164 [Arctium lappa]|uniref:Uncharacterized protein n=1 Tax=Arctium lappa TaxID=4217 RepID=A0ACB8XKA4_ARCLA|nr:hypothetical protein L6452_43164 [Arctium lappa]
MCDTVPWNKCDNAPSHDEVLNEFNTEGTPVSAVTVSEGMMIVKRNFEQRYREMNNSSTTGRVASVIIPFTVAGRGHHIPGRRHSTGHHLDPVNIRSLLDTGRYYNTTCPVTRTTGR